MCYLLNWKREMKSKNIFLKEFLIYKIFLKEHRTKITSCICKQHLYLSFNSGRLSQLLVLSAAVFLVWNRQ